MNSKTIFAALAGAALLAAPQAGLAKSADLPTEEVVYHDLDLATGDGQAELQRRVRAASRNVCLYQVDGERATASDTYKCSRKAMRGGREQMSAAIDKTRYGG